MKLIPNQLLGQFRVKFDLDDYYIGDLGTKADYYTNGGDYWKAFDDNAPERKIYVPTSALDAYKEAKFWQDYADDIVDGIF